MNRIKQTFAKLKENKQKALISYIVAGDPNLDATVPAMHALVAGGTDIIELGVAFSDPVADGSIIQAGHQRALNAGSTLKKTLQSVKAFRAEDSITPVVLMSYINPIEILGYDTFVNLAIEAQVDGVLIVDMPPEESESLTIVMRAKGISPIFLVAPTTRTERLKNIAVNADGFIYYVSLKGVTGTKTIDTSLISKKIEEIRSYTQTPVGVGFGIKDSDSAKAAAQYADAIIVGSAFVNIMESYAKEPAELNKRLQDMAAELKSAINL